MSLATSSVFAIGYFESSPFGIMEWQDISMLKMNDTGFAGHEWDSTPRLQYMKARWYDAEIGRFISHDPASPDRYRPMSFNPYLYAENNPLKYVDPDGKKLKKVTLRRLDVITLAKPGADFLFDDQISAGMFKSLTAAFKKFDGLSVNNSFRTAKSSSLKTKYTKAKGLSRHQGGFAVDLNGVSGLKAPQIKALDKIMRGAGAFPLKNKRMRDPGHYSINPALHGYDSLRDAVDTNLLDWTNNFKGMELYQYD